MIRKLAIAITLISAGYTGLANALGLGDAKVNSNLNQPLVAEIDLVNTGGLTDAEILPGLATREEFLRAGIDRVYFLSDLRFDVSSGADGQPKIVLTTRKPVREPFLNFLVEVIWPSGRLLREYSLLIDPPVFAEDKPVVAAPAPAGVSSSAPAPTPVAPEAAPRTALVSGDAVVRSVTPQAGELSGSESYGPTKRSDTLWEIATKVRPDRSVSPQQVMLAIQDLNPDAFIDSNINKLKEGQILRLPNKDQIVARSSYEAINAVIEQNAAIRKPKTKTPKSSAAKPSAEPASAPQRSGDQLKLVVPNKDSEASDSASSDPSGSASSGGASAEDISLTLEQLDKAKLENAELSDKVGDLEEQLETLQRILTLKNDQLASMQAQMRANELEEAEGATEEAADKVATTDTEGAEGAEEVLSEAESPAVEEAAANDEAQPLTEVVVSETVTDTALVNSEGEVVAEEVVVEERVVVAPATQTPEQAEQTSVQQKPIQERILVQIMSNPIYQAAVAGGLVLLLALLWLLSHARHKQEARPEDDDGVDYEPVEYEDEVDEYAEEDAGEAQEESLAGEEEPAAAEGQEDVIAEAEVYIAYGRLDQAATILEDGISADPVRVDYRLKLLEVYRDSLQSDAFDKQISELEAIQDQDALTRAAEIRAELDEKLNEEGGIAAPVEEVEQLLDEDEEQALLQGDDNNFDFDTVDEDKADAAEQAADPVEEELEAYAKEALDEVGEEVDFDSDELDVDLDIDLDIDDDMPETGELEQDPGIDFESVDLSGDDLEAPEVSAEEKADLEIDEDLSLDSDELDQENEIDLDLGGELELEDDDLVSADEALELEDEELSLDSDDASSDDTVDEAVQEEAVVDDLELDLDELEGESVEDMPLDLSEELESDIAEGEASLPEVDAEDQAEAAESAPDSDVLDMGEGDDLEITDETLDEAAEALGDAEDFEPELNEDEDFDFLEGTDEASTKLDLARAYIDMGDADGAKEILQEVEKEGSPEQQQQARDLIESLGS